MGDLAQLNQKLHIMGKYDVNILRAELINEREITSQLKQTYEEECQQSWRLRRRLMRQALSSTQSRRNNLESKQAQRGKTEASSPGNFVTENVLDPLVGNLRRNLHLRERELQQCEACILEAEACHRQERQVIAATLHELGLRSEQLLGQCIAVNNSDTEAEVEVVALSNNT